jgi:hypothetical protein
MTISHGFGQGITKSDLTDMVSPVLRGGRGWELGEGIYGTFRWKNQYQVDLDFV